MKFQLDNYTYQVIKNEKEGFDLEELQNKYGEFFWIYDYIVGDWAYDKLRLKGFNKKSNKHFNKINDFNNVDEYIKNNCAYECRHFIIEKIVE